MGEKIPILRKKNKANEIEEKTNETITFKQAIKAIVTYRAFWLKFVPAAIAIVLAINFIIIYLIRHI